MIWKVNALKDQIGSNYCHSEIQYFFFPSRLKNLAEKKILLQKALAPLKNELEEKNGKLQVLFARE